MASSLVLAALFSGLNSNSIHALSCSIKELWGQEKPSNYCELDSQDTNAIKYRRLLEKLRSTHRLKYLNCSDDFLLSSVETVPS